MNYRILAFPCLVYLASLGTRLTVLESIPTHSANISEKGMGITFFYVLTRPEALFTDTAEAFDFGVAFWSISLSLNLLLMLMIVIRLGIHQRNIRKAMGGSAGAGGMYKAVIAMLIESFSLYAINFLLYTGPWIVNNFAQYIFLPILSQTQVRVLHLVVVVVVLSNRSDEQVIAPFLIVLRVANRTAITSKAIVSGNIGSMRFESQGNESTDGGVTVPDGDPVGSVKADGENTGELGVVIEEVPL